MNEFLLYKKTKLLARILFYLFFGIKTNIEIIFVYTNIFGKN